MVKKRFGYFRCEREQDLGVPDVKESRRDNMKEQKNDQKYREGSRKESHRGR